MKEKLTQIHRAKFLPKLQLCPSPPRDYKAGNDDVRHLGAVAQAFCAAFGVGADDKHPAAFDGNGVALAAIQGSNLKVESGKQEAEIRIARLEAENAALQQTVNELKELVQTMNQKLSGITR